MRPNEQGLLDICVDVVFLTIRSRKAKYRSTMNKPLTLPPVYTPQALADGAASARDEARRVVGEGAETGTLVFSPAEDWMHCAVVLEPDQAATVVHQIIFVASVALADAIGSAAPAGPNCDLVWPGQIRINSGFAGGVTLDISEETDESGVPIWAVVSASVRLAPEHGVEAGERLDITCLHQEGGERVTSGKLTESFARYFLVGMDQWENDGFGPVRRQWQQRATLYTRDVIMTLGDQLIAGEFVELLESGDLLLGTRGGQETLSLEDALRIQPSFP